MEKRIEKLEKEVEEQGAMQMAIIREIVQSGYCTTLSRLDLILDNQIDCKVPGSKGAKEKLTILTQLLETAKT